MRIELGLTAKPLQEQLAGHCREEVLEAMQNDANAITLLQIRGYITKPEARQIRHKLVKAIQGMRGE